MAPIVLHDRPKLVRGLTRTRTTLQLLTLLNLLRLKGYSTTPPSPASRLKSACGLPLLIDPTALDAPAPRRACGAVRTPKMSRETVAEVVVVDGNGVEPDAAALDEEARECVEAESPCCEEEEEACTSCRSMPDGRFAYSRILFVNGSRACEQAASAYARGHPLQATQRGTLTVGAKSPRPVLRRMDLMRTEQVNGIVMTIASFVPSSSSSSSASSISWLSA